MVCGLRIGFESTTSVMWTYKVLHLEWARNQAVGLN